jgi:F-type H+-transporting ATPase subunit b
MKKFFCWLALALLLVGFPAVTRAQESKSESAEANGEAGLKMWEWANFLVLAGGIGYLIWKNAGPAFEARGRHIRKAMLEAEDAKKDAERRFARIEARLAGLDAEIARLRAEAQREEQSESARSAARAEAEVAKIQARAEQEIAAAGKAAVMELRRHTAHLALQLAEQKISARMTPETEDQLVHSFLDNLHGPSSSAYAD